jgi:talin
VGLLEVDAKVKYTQLARSLKTYGITFFLVKEKVKGKNKLVPRLLGITKEAVVRVDEKTKEVSAIYSCDCECVSINTSLLHVIWQLLSIF